MQNFTIAVGTFLIVLGVVAYFVTGAASFTALIPSMFGVILAGFGKLAKNPAKTKTFMHFAALLAVVGLIGSLQGLPQTFSLIAGDEIDRPGAAISRAIMAITLFVFLVAAVRSFVEARKARRVAESGA